MTTALLPALDAFLEATREEQRQRILQPIECGLERAFMTAFEDQEGRFLRLLGRVRHLWVDPVVLEETLEPKDWEPLWALVQLASQRKMQGPMVEAMKKALLAGGKAAIADVGLGLSFDLANPDAVAYLERAPLKIAGINESTREEIRRILIKGVEEGWSYDRTARELKAKFESFRKPQPQQHIRSRAHLIAITETGDAYVQGSMAVAQRLQRAGLKMEKRWLDVEDEREDDVCLANGAEGWIPLEQPFSSGHMAPTAHPACRCDLETRAVL